MRKKQPAGSLHCTFKRCLIGEIDSSTPQVSGKSISVHISGECDNFNGRFYQLSNKCGSDPSGRSGDGYSIV
ncbi:hypothetical protein GCM10010924_37690 [Rhizobium wenxiniae]|uniref:Uncharacterized protein n=1 Tax=Rhizobium wenxiniae TaxID=1737357 RepID=A0A7W9YA62_9HYPH|nr:hypothetical protein [Rhizobium wenxiniae]GGG05547.1 hypothetical protein GCM10010924_37690 [Rhizobium wenxiniae]